MPVKNKIKANSYHILLKIEYNWTCSEPISLNTIITQ